MITALQPLLKCLSLPFDHLSFAPVAKWEGCPLASFPCILLPPPISQNCQMWKVTDCWPTAMETVAMETVVHISAPAPFLSLFHSPKNWTLGCKGVCVSSHGFWVPWASHSGRK